MPLVVVDSSVALPATLSPRGLARKFWVLLALGALTHREAHLRLDLEALDREAAETGGTIGGRPAIETLIERAGERRAALAELLPYDAPSDWTAAGSAYLFDEYERKVRVVAAKLGRDIDDHEAAQLRRQVEAVCIAGPPLSTPRRYRPSRPIRPTTRSSTPPCSLELISSSVTTSTSFRDGLTERRSTSTINGASSP